MVPSALLRRVRWRRVLGVALALVATFAAARAGAQRGYFRNYIEPNAEYDGQFTFVRLRYTGWSSRWIADYPAMERNFMTILNDLTTVHPRVGQSNILTMDDPELSRYAVAYVCEPGFWTPTDGEATALRQWIAKGGFLIVDDFYDRQWDTFERAMKKVLPDGRIVPLDVSPTPSSTRSSRSRASTGWRIPTTPTRRRSTSASTRATIPRSGCSS
jgi:hypothetical protein